MRPVEAHYDAGVLTLATPLPLRPGERVAVVLVQLPDPSRWNMERMATEAPAEDSTLAESGLSGWADAFDREDSS